MKWQKSGEQHHNALRKDERYHALLCNTYGKLNVEFPQMNKHLLLSMVVKAGNDTLGPDEIISSVLVFGQFPTVRTILGPPSTKTHVS